MAAAIGFAERFAFVRFLRAMGRRVAIAAVLPVIVSLQRLPDLLVQEPELRHTLSHLEYFVV